MVDRLSPLRERPAHPIRLDFPGQAHAAHDAGSKRVMDGSGISIEPCPTSEPKRSGAMCGGSGVWSHPVWVGSSPLPDRSSGMLGLGQPMIDIVEAAGISCSSTKANFDVWS